VTTLVTGARGGLGRVLCPALLAAGEKVVPTGRAPGPGERYVACDLADPAAVAELVRFVRPNRVYHLAGSFSNDFDQDFAVNGMGARNLLEALRHEGIAARVVVMGSAAEYGRLDERENPVSEDRVLRPTSIYGLTKAFQTQLALQHAHAHGSDVVVARMFNLLAPGLSERLFVGRVERQIDEYRAGRSRTIEVGNLDSRRDYLDADEAIAQITTIAERGRAGEVYHVGSGRPITMRELLFRMLDASNVPREAVLEAVPHAHGRTGYDVPLIYADMTRTRQLEGTAG
jgi:nucleoside-diphosphate-sugar epimerase